MSHILSGQAPTILDVRTKMEYDNGHVPGAIWVPFYAVPWSLDILPTGPEEPVVVYCTHGLRAGLARFVLRLAGFEHVTYLEGHLLEWRREQLPLERSSAHQLNSGKPSC